MISTIEWQITIAVIAVIVILDLLLAILRRHQTTSMTEAGIWTAIYVSAAIAFGIALPQWSNPQTGGEFFAGWLTEYALSVDNLFIFVLILTRLKIKKEKQQLALLIGIIIALVLRVIAIFLGAAAIKEFEWVFFFFGAFLIYTAYKLLKGNEGHEGEPEEETKLVSFLQRRGWKPFGIAIVALGFTDLLFALDSIPAIFGLTQNVYVVVTANVFALMGLRQLYFLLAGLFDRLIYLPKGLAFILAFIGIKLFLHALHTQEIDTVAGLYIPEITLGFSLGVIVTTLAVTTLISLYVTKKRAKL